MKNLSSTTFFLFGARNLENQFLILVEDQKTGRKLANMSIEDKNVTLRAGLFKNEAVTCISVILST